MNPYVQYGQKTWKVKIKICRNFKTNTNFTINYQLTKTKQDILPICSSPLIYTHTGTADVLANGKVYNQGWKKKTFPVWVCKHFYQCARLGFILYDLCFWLLPFIISFLVLCLICQSKKPGFFKIYILTINMVRKLRLGVYNLVYRAFWNIKLNMG